MLVPTPAPSRRRGEARPSRLPPLPKGGCPSAHTGAGGYVFCLRRRGGLWPPPKAFPVRGEGGAKRRMRSLSVMASRREAEGGGLAAYTNTMGGSALDMVRIRPSYVSGLACRTGDRKGVGRPYKGKATSSVIRRTETRRMTPSPQGEGFGRAVRERPLSCKPRFPTVGAHHDAPSPSLPPAGEGGSRRSPARRLTDEGEGKTIAADPLFSPSPVSCADILPRWGRNRPLRHHRKRRRHLPLRGEAFVLPAPAAGAAFGRFLYHPFDQATRRSAAREPHPALRATFPVRGEGDGRTTEDPAAWQPPGSMLCKFRRFADRED